jgi:MMP 1-O-methyltransferase
MLSSLDGLISNAEGHRLAGLAAQVPSDQDIVELGSYRGKSTAFLASSGHHVYAIDRWTMGGQRVKGMGYDDPRTFEAFWQQLKAVGVADKVTALRSDSALEGRHWSHPVGLLFIDADHSEASVRADLAAWEPHCVGVIAFDDYAPRWPGVMRVADELIERRGVRHELTDGLMAVWIRPLQSQEAKA